VQIGQMRRGVLVPAVALMKNPVNQSVVWVKTAPERFEPHVVEFAPLDGSHVLVTSGLAGGERVVVQAAALLNQVR
ncbi:MAG TPA: efflux RND transporter periplasmic adaptor subunit, partial [Rhodocyclaceae bacterium]|nr:efflux RND transporter periplasmic adaptor subunit [Rhodocyclaceae bacterium]